MKTQGAILWERNEAWVVEELEIDAPKAGEVLVRYVATGLCHSDDHTRTGDMGPIPLPLLGGHEGAGIVEEVGPGVTSLAPGDHVVATFIPSCGTCRWCSTGHQNLCDLGAVILDGLMVDGTSRLHARGQDVRSQTMVGTFAGHNVVNEHSLVKIDDDLPLDRAYLLGCGVTTGWGAAVNAAAVQPGDTVVVIGCGGIGGSAIQGARIAGAQNIVAVDTAPQKKDMITTLGATHFATSMEEAFALVADLTRGVMADSALLTVGLVHGPMIAQALSLVRKAGTAVLVGVAPGNETTASLPMLEMALFQKTLKGSLFGSSNARADIPRLLRLYQSGQLLLDQMVTKTYTLAQVNDGFDDMLAGNNIRGVIALNQ